MAQLAIKGHETRGKEVIKTLEMLGGRIMYTYNGDDDTAIYFIDGLYIMAYKLEDIESIEFKVFTLEEFLEKYPYKVGDEVYNIIHNEKQTITNLVWQENEVVYQTNNKEYVYVNYLQPYREERNEKSVNHVFDTEVISFDIAQRDKYELDLQGKFHVVLREGKYYVERIKPQYPKTYEECRKVLGIEEEVIVQGGGYKHSFVRDFYKLLICRDAYWKIAGNELRLNEPWRYDMSKDEFSSAITYRYGLVQKNEVRYNNHILVFPTAEMRDAFYENFKDLIGKCEKLL